VFSTLLDLAYLPTLDLFCLLVCRMVNVATSTGCAGRPRTPMAIGHCARPGVSPVSRGISFSQLACDLVEKHGLHRLPGKGLPCDGYRCPLDTNRSPTALDFNRAAFRAASETGELTYACYSVDRAV